MKETQAGAEDSSARVNAKVQQIERWLRRNRPYLHEASYDNIKWVLCEIECALGNVQCPDTVLRRVAKRA